MASSQLGEASKLTASTCFVEASNGLSYGAGISGTVPVLVTGHGHGSVADPSNGYFVRHSSLNYGLGVSGSLSVTTSAQSTVQLIADNQVQGFAVRQGRQSQRKR
eukprot:TRINITY_DN11073_c1_g1_i1.p1 TRINITY_DN11073_c1_g1~~TRINITY_DN11073_c1_g1_i1.p1  ORF type:complete len:105 (+),score=18.55 TRINITY_DN11073_c1_g1_i1:95-409(+)